MNYLNYPNPIFIRETTEIINDGWLFSFDKLNWRPINVPFCPESKLSGIGFTDFIRLCYYKKTFVSSKPTDDVILNFGAVDYRATVEINGKYVGTHTGGYTAFAFNITDFLVEGHNEIMLTVLDCEQRACASGKQSYKKNSFGCFYTRTTGIWQNVWIERAPEKYVREICFYPDVQKCRVTADILTNGEGALSIEVSFGGKVVGRYDGNAVYRRKAEIPLGEKHLWGIGKGNLYDVKIRFGDDVVYSYFGLRSVRYEGFDFLLNGERVYQKLVLDQGYYPDGIYTAPGLDAMQRDIDSALTLGFNGARLHQKVFDPRFLYLCDKAGYMVWGEFPCWGVDYSSLEFIGQFLSEWGEAIRRDFNHPSIITWCPLNEIWGTWEDIRQTRDVRFVDAVYEFTKMLDPTRPCVDTSGGHHGHCTDLFDFHCYEDVPVLKKVLDDLDEAGTLDLQLLYSTGEDLKYSGDIPVNLSECGGICLSSKRTEATKAVNDGPVDSETSWGYGKGETNGDDFVERYRALMKTIGSCKKLSGFCYTQLYDIEQECNGFYDYNRSDKLTPAQKRQIKAINDSVG